MDSACAVTWAMQAEPPLRERAGLYDDPSTLARLKERSPRAQEEVWRLERRRLTSLAESIVRSSSEAEALVADLFQDFFHRYVDQLQRSQAIPSYLRIMALRRARRRKERSLHEVVLEADAATADPTAELDARMDDRRWLGRLEQCLALLGRRARGILRLHYGHEQSYSAISAELGVSKQAVGKTVQKSLEALRRCLEKGAPG
jgi:RNA polymerase sigma factor (sigma-70 family)